MNANRVVEVPNASTTAGQQLALYDYNGCNCQKWTLSTVTTARLATAVKDSITGLQIFPNPASGTQGVTIALPPAPVTRIRIINAAGTVVRDQQTQKVSRINIGQGQPAGIYFIQISTPDAAVTKKIVIQ